MCLTGENIGATAVEAEAELAWFSPGNGSHRLLLYLTASSICTVMDKMIHCLPDDTLHLKTGFLTARRNSRSLKFENCRCYYCSSSADGYFVKTLLRPAKGKLAVIN